MFRIYLLVSPLCRVRGLQMKLQNNKMFNVILKAKKTKKLKFENYLDFMD